MQLELKKNKIKEILYMLRKQKVAFVQASSYEDLRIEIENTIENYHEQLYEVQQIDYFGMDSQNHWNCSAFILFNSIKK